jgi:hypothetical protein
VPPPEVAVHVNVVPAVSEVTETASQPDVDVTADSGSVTLQLTATSETCQPLLPAVPDSVGVMTGAVRSSPTGLHSHTPTLVLEAEPSEKLPPIGYQPKPTWPRTGCPDSSSDDV